MTTEADKALAGRSDAILGTAGLGQLDEMCSARGGFEPPEAARQFRHEMRVFPVAITSCHWRVAGA